MALKAHVGFSVPEIPDANVKIISHFSALGYHLTEQTPGKWVFRRGRKSAVLIRFDIRAYATTLTVCANPTQDSQVSVSCDWQVWTFIARPNAGDVAALKAEGHQLESSLHGKPPQANGVQR